MIRVTLSFDDGRADNYRAAEEILTPMRIPATFNITTGYVDGTAPPEQRPCENVPLSVEQVQELYGMGFEIAGHGDRHLNTLEDTKEGITKLRVWIPQLPEAIGLASPESKLPVEEIMHRRAALEELGVRYVRVGLRPCGQTAALSRKLLRKAGQITKSTALYNMAYSASLLSGEDRFIQFAIPVMRYTTLAQVEALMEYATRAGKDCVLMFHSILKPDEPFYDSTWSWDYDDFTALCEFLQNLTKIRICKSMEYNQ